jgi:hypothetical protein
VHSFGTLAFLVFPALLLLWSRGGLAGSPWPAAVVAAAFGAAQVRDALANIRAPREWDYGCFWLYAHVARAHGNLYDPQTFARVRLPFAIDSDFVAAVVNVGFPYPPPSIALFLPLGGIDGVSAGLAAWYVARAVAFVVAVVALQRAFFPRDGARGGILVAALALLLPSLASDTAQAQTNVFLLALLALAFLGRERTWGACLGALAIWVKPYAVALVLCDLAAGRVRRTIAAALTIAASLAASVALVGSATFASYWRSNPAAREPASAFTESVNQSLFAVVARATHAPLGAHVAPLQLSAFVILALTPIAFATLACARYRRETDLCFALALELGLLLYPGTLASYGTAAILPLLVLWSRRATLPLRSAGTALLGGAVVALQGPLHAGFAANALLFGACLLALPAAATNGPGRARPRPFIVRSRAA